MRQIVDFGIIVLFNEYGRCYVLREKSPIFMDSDGISKVVFRAILSFYFLHFRCMQRSGDTLC